MYIYTINYHFACTTTMRFITPPIDELQTTRVQRRLLHKRVLWCMRGDIATG